MATLFEEFDENRALSGVGCGLYYKNLTGKYSLLAPLETVPSFGGNPESIEFDITTSSTKGKVPGKITLDEKEVDILNHRDNMIRLKEFEGKVLEFMKVLPDYSGEKATGRIYFSSQDSTSGDLEKATVKFILLSYDGVVQNCYDLIQPTCHFLTAIDSVVHLNSAELSKTYTLDIAVTPTAGTVTAVSKTESVATVTCTSNKLVITPVKKGSAIIELTASCAECAPWTTTVLVIVK